MKISLNDLDVEIVVEKSSFKHTIKGNFLLCQSFFHFLMRVYLKSKSKFYSY